MPICSALNAVRSRRPPLPAASSGLSGPPSSWGRPAVRGRSPAPGDGGEGERGQPGPGPEGGGRSSPPRSPDGSGYLQPGLLPSAPCSCRLSRSFSPCSPRSGRGWSPRRIGGPRPRMVLGVGCPVWGSWGPGCSGTATPRRTGPWSSCLVSGLPGRRLPESTTALYRKPPRKTLFV